MIISLIGVLVIVGQPLLSRGVNGEILGNLFFVLATIGAVGHAVFSKEIMPKYSAVTVTFWSFLIGSITFFPFFVYEMINLHPLTSLDSRGLTGIVFGIFLSSALAYFLFEWGTKKLAAQEIGLFTYIDPVAAIIIAIPLLHETITPIFIIGSLLVFSGIFIAEGRLHYHPLHKLRKF